MFRQTLTKVPKVPSRRAFSITARAMSEGDTGAPPKTGGPGDAFQKRERAQEDYAIRMREKEKLLELKKKLSEQQYHLKKLADHIDELTKTQGGEQN
ncbi:putative mitochondrial ATPase inhibitor [Camillea tinctor]|nr:putative mitochondrial ATPase inhibitor [Camillea tinctor]